MPLPSKKDGEDRGAFISRCLNDKTAKKEFPNMEQRTAVCMSRACDGITHLAAADFQIEFAEYGYSEPLTPENWVCPSEEDYVDFGENSYEWDVSKADPKLWRAIHEYKVEEQNDQARSKFKYKDPQTGEIFEYDRKGIYRKNGRILVPVRASEYQGRKVKLNKPFRTPDGPKKFSVYVKNKKGNVVKVNFGDKSMTIKKDNPERRKSFRARHKCDTATDKTTPRYWSCKMW